jgi:hypothetical protein
MGRPEECLRSAFFIAYLSDPSHRHYPVRSSNDETRETNGRFRYIWTPCVETRGPLSDPSLCQLSYPMYTGLNPVVLGLGRAWRGVVGSANVRLTVRRRLTASDLGLRCAGDAVTRYWR